MSTGGEKTSVTPKFPAGFLKSIYGRPVVVKKNTAKASAVSKKKKRRVESEYDMKPCSQSALRRSTKKKNCDFLFAEEFGREYLVRYGGGGSGDDSESRVVGIEILRGKYVGILFPQPPGYARHCYRVLKQVYKEIRDKHGDVFEIVFVAKMDDKDDDYEKRNLPFLAVPFVDLKWRERLCNEYFSVKNRYNEPRYLLLFDPQGRPLKNEGEFNICEDILEALTLEFGSAFYPFTAAREMQLIEEGLAAVRSKSLQVILGGDYVISNDGHTKVPISLLRDNVVGLFFYDNRRSPILSSFKKLLLNIYNQLKEGQYNFEIIFVNVSYCGGYIDEQTFLRKLKNMPWLALPFNDQRVWRLYSMFTPGEDAANLTIIGPSHNLFVETRGFPIIKEYGIEAYPFSEDATVNAKIERLRKLKLADFLEGMGVEYLLCKSKRRKTRTSTIQVPNQVLLYIASWSSDEDRVPPHKSKESSRLLNMYKKLDQSFKVVFLSLDYDKTSFAQHFDTMPPSWLAIPFKMRDAYYDHERILSPLPHLIAFDGSSGCLLKMGILESFGADGADAFPFITDQHFFEFIRDSLPQYLTPGFPGYRL